MLFFRFSKDNRSLQKSVLGVSQSDPTLKASPTNFLTWSQSSRHALPLACDGPSRAEGQCRQSDKGQV